MTGKRTGHWLAAAAILSAMPLASVQGQDPQAPAPAEAASQRVVLQNNTAGEFLYVDEYRPQGEYWIGISLGELPPVARQQLQLDGGLVVQEVLPDSPAAKAQFKQYDVLLKANDKPLAAPADIQNAVEEAKETELAIVAVRDGEQLTLKVTPVKRPKPEATQTQPVEVDAVADLRRTSINKIEEALQELKGKSDHEAIELYFARPAVVTPGRVKVELPKDTRIIVTMEGDGPAKVQVLRGDKEWNVTADRTAELPEDVRRHVEQLLGKATYPMLTYRAPAITTAPRAPLPPPVAGPQPGYRDPQLPQPVTLTGPAQLHAYRVANRGDGVDAKLNLILKKLETLESKSLDELHEEVKRLRKELDELRK